MNDDDQTDPCCNTEYVDEQRRLTDESFAGHVSELTARHPELRHVVAKWGNPPFWTHEPAFPGIVIAILAQQVSLESAQAAYAKLERETGEISPEGFLSLENKRLKQIGFSRQKASYVRGIANAIVSGELNLATLETMTDESARTFLTGLRGVGAWTADTYLLFSLCRADVWPTGDLALEKAIQELEVLPEKPASAVADRIADIWRPLRAVAARVLWHHYLCERGRASLV